MQATQALITRSKMKFIYINSFTIKVNYELFSMHSLIIGKLYN